MTDRPADELLLRFPARSGYLGMSRLNATALAASADFDVQELDDIRLAVDEAVAWLLADDPDGSVEIKLRCSLGELDFRAVLIGPAAPPRQLDELIHAILGATTDRYEAGADAQDRRFLSFSKRRDDG